MSRGAEVSLLSARKFWHALGFPVVDTDDELFTEADQKALAAVAGIVRDGLLDEPTALAMTRAFARSADRLAGWQSQLIAEAVENHMTARRWPSEGDDDDHGVALGARHRDRDRDGASASRCSPTASSRSSSTRGAGTCRPRWRACSPTPTPSPTA